MTAIETSPFISAPLADVVPTGAETDSQGTRKADTGAVEKWQYFIDYKLIEWGRDPALIEDDGVEPPTADTILQAIDLAKAMKHGGLPAPDSVVPDPNGGIVFERREGEFSEVVHIWDDGSVEFRRFQGTHMIDRMPLLSLGAISFR